MQIYKLNRKAEGYPSGTLAFRLRDVDHSNCKGGSITCEVIDDSGPKLKMKNVTFAASRLTFLAALDLNVARPKKLTPQIAHICYILANAR
jgi:hypothetical protein